MDEGKCCMIFKAISTFDQSVVANNLSQKKNTNVFNEVQ